MTKEEKLAILNSMKVVESDGDGECLYYAYVENSVENIEKIAQVVPNVEKFIKEYSSENRVEEPGLIDIQFAVWDYTDANYFTGDCFIIDREYT